MATCASCGAEVLIKRLDHVPHAVDMHESGTGPGRFVERDGALVPVKATSEVVAFVSHKQTCGPR